MRSQAAQLVLALVLALGWLVTPPVWAQNAAPAFTREELMAVFLYRLGSYVEWPESSLAAEDPTLQLCIVGRDPFGSALSYHAGAPLKGRSFEIKRIDPGDPIEGCQILFLSASETRGRRVLERLATLHGVLSTSDRPDFTCRGGILRFYVAEESLKLEIDPDAAQRAGLQISSKVLSLAQIREPDACEGEQP